ncbi:hypothetical protein GCM10009850_083530 [Nonomuraea monospora]|uniref:Uncharacterized protein n=1 Tax=Nonomuraea monospora TaxID=568818 RepID=A0ABP5PMH2_9ACTN
MVDEGQNYIRAGFKGGNDDTRTAGGETLPMSLSIVDIPRPWVRIQQLGVSLLSDVSDFVSNAPLPALQQQYTDDSTIDDGDEALMNILKEIPIIGGTSSAEE